MQIKYKSGVGEIIWAMTTCRPDIAFTSNKQSQSNSAPTKHHYHGLKHSIRYLYATCNDGIYFCRTQSQIELPDGALPTVNSNPHDLLLDNRPNHDATTAVAYAFNSPAEQSHTRQNSNQPLPSHRPRLSSWQPQTSAECASLSVAFCGTSTLHWPKPVGRLYSDGQSY